VQVDGHNSSKTAFKRVLTRYQRALAGVYIVRCPAVF
jgi:hypothetical protein